MPDEDPSPAMTRGDSSAPRATGDRVRSAGVGLLLTLLVWGAVAPLGSRPPGLRFVLAAALFTGLAMAAARVTGVLLEGAPSLSRLALGFAVAVAMVTVPATLLGTVGVLSAQGLYAVIAVALAVSRILPVPAGGGAPDGPPAGRIERVLVVTAVSGLAAYLLVLVLAGRNLPPGAHAYDDTSYHLSAVATWRAHGDLRMIKFAVGDGGTAFYPITGELWSFFLLSAIDPSDYLARFSELPFALFALVSVAAIARRLGLGAVAAGAAALLYATVPRVYPALMLSAGNDNAVAFFALAAVLAALELAREPRAGRACAAGLAAGLLLGTKYTGLILGLPLLVLIAVTSFWPDDRERRSGGLLRLLAAGACAASAGEFTYLRNLVTAGNPVFPAPVKLAGHVLFPGWAEAAAEKWSARPEFPIDPLAFLVGHVDFFGPLFRILVLPAAVLAPLAVLLVAGSFRQRLRTFFVLALPAVFYVEFLRLMIDHRDIRYFLAGIALACVGVVFCVERLPGSLAAPARVLLALTALATLAVSVGARSRGAILAIAGLGLVVSLLERVPAALARGARPAGAALPIAVLVVAAAASPAVPGLLAGYERGRLEEDGVARELDRRTAAAPATVAVVGGNQPYLLFGTRLQNDVLYVPTFGDRSVSWMTWSGGPGFPRDRAEWRAWVANLSALGVRWVFVRREGGELPELGWLEVSPEKFEWVAHQDSADLFEVKPGRVRGPERFTIDPASPRLGSFLGEGWYHQSAAGGAELLVPEEGAEIRIPPLGSPPERLEIRLNGAAGPALQVDWDGQTLGRPSVPASGGVVALTLPRTPAPAPHLLRLSVPGASLGPPFPIGGTGATVPVPLVVRSAGLAAGSRLSFRVAGEEYASGERGYTLARLAPGGRSLGEERRFDTGSEASGSSASQAMAEWVGRLGPGEVVLGAVADEGASGLGRDGLGALRRLGSALQPSGKFRWGHAFVGVVGAPVGSIPEWSDARPAVVAVGRGLARIARISVHFAPMRRQDLEDPGIPAAVDDPPAGAVVHGPLFVRGWCQQGGGGPVTPAAFLVDGVPRNVLSLSRVSRPDVSAALPWVGDSSRAGYEALIEVSDLKPGPHLLVVRFSVPDGRIRTYAPRPFVLAE